MNLSRQQKRDQYLEISKPSQNRVETLALTDANRFSCTWLMKDSHQSPQLGHCLWLSFLKSAFDSLQQRVTACWATACCPHVPRVLRDLRFEHGFSPMHWSAQRGRRDLIEFIRQQVASALAWRTVRTVGVDKV